MLGRRGITALSVVAGAALLLVPGAAGTAASLSITPIIYGSLGTNGWYTSNVTVNWSIQADPPLLESVGCGATTFTADTLGTQLECRARNDPNEPNDWVRVTKTFKIDKTAPVVTSAAARAPDSNGWYNHPVGVTFSGADATSGLASLSAASTGYGGPDNPTAVVGGTCVDRAGNVATAAVSLKYDATAPTLFVTSKTGKRGSLMADVVRYRSSR